MPITLTDRRSNNWDSLRLLAAWLVILIHSFGMVGEPIPFFHITTDIIRFGQVGVYIFFTISGYLISSSWIRDPDPINYFRNRILRIFPALIVVILLTIFVLGPLFTKLTLPDYFSQPDTFRYLWNITLWKTVYVLPGVFDGRAVNAPLWTLFFEFAMYVSVAFFGLSGLFRNSKSRVFFIVLFLYLLIVQPYFHDHPIYALKINFSDLVRFGAFFYAGVLFNLYRQHIPISYKWIVLIVSLLVCVIFFGEPLFYAFIVLFISTATIMIGSTRRQLLEPITRHGDFSYGFYIYGYPIQHALAECGILIDPYLFALLSILCTAPFAVMSWRLVEKRFLAMKR